MIEDVADRRLQELNDSALEPFLAAFYAKVRRDPDLGPVFAAAIPDTAWPAHLATIRDFWSSVLFRTGRYKGNPFGAHVEKGIRPDHFVRWLGLFSETAREFFVPQDALILEERADRIAESLKSGLYFRPGAAGSRPT